MTTGDLMEAYLRATAAESRLRVSAAMGSDVRGGLLRAAGYYGAKAGELFAELSTRSAASGLEDLVRAPNGS